MIFICLFHVIFKEDFVGFQYKVLIDSKNSNDN